MLAGAIYIADTIYLTGRTKFSTLYQVYIWFLNLSKEDLMRIKWSPSPYED